MDTPTFELAEVSKAYDGAPVLRSLNLTIPWGETTVLLGPSGCGKSTIIRLMVGLARPDTGIICFEGAAISPANVEDLRRRMGYVIQEGGLFPHLTAAGNVALMARYLRMDEARIAARIGELANLLRFPEAGLGRYPVQLSGGERQRVSLMRALMLDPDVLLLDEPLGALDPMIRRDLQKDLKEIFRALGKTAVMVTHDIGEAGFFADRIVLMRDGEVAQTGSLRDLVVDPASSFVEDFVNAQRSPLESLEREQGTGGRG
jgi:osmoprotectant transport system ATP-binding protein